MQWGLLGFYLPPPLLCPFQLVWPLPPTPCCLCTHLRADCYHQLGAATFFFCSGDLANHVSPNPGNALTPQLPVSVAAPPDYLARPGLILSPALDPFPQPLIQRVQSGQFIEMRDLLADNIALLSKLSSLHGVGTAYHHCSAHKSTRGSLSDIVDILLHSICGHPHARPVDLPDGSIRTIDHL